VLQFIQAPPDELGAHLMAPTVRPGFWGLAGHVAGALDGYPPGRQRHGDPAGADSKLQHVPAAGQSCEELLHSPEHAFREATRGRAVPGNGSRPGAAPGRQTPGPLPI